MGEFDFIESVRRRTPADPRVLLGPGDDCAVLAPTGSAPLLVTTDVLTEGVDFLLAETDPEAVGFKAMGANLSDIAAMAGEPLAAVVGLVLPRTGGRVLADAVDRGLRRMAERFGVPIVGGDTNVWDGGLVVSVTVLGRAVPPGAVRRSGARPGDWLFVTGPLGGSLLGRHLAPNPRIAEALRLHALVGLRAMADISDGLAADLGHILEESGCGAELDAASVPIHADAARRSALTGRPALEHALHDGEDFELVFAVAPADGPAVERSGLAVRIGACVEAGLWLREGGGRRALERRGWEHGVE